MKNVLMLAIVSLLLSCSSTENQKKVAWESWISRPVKEIEKHPYFRNLPVKKIKHANGIETWLYRDQSRFQSDSYCQSLGGCQGLPIYNCDNAFSIQDGIILGFEQNGSCPGPKVILPRP